MTAFTLTGHPSRGARRQTLTTRSLCLCVSTVRCFIPNRDGERFISQSFQTDRLRPLAVERADHLDLVVGVMLGIGLSRTCVLMPRQLAAMVAARPNMIATLDTFRDTLEDLGGGLGVTDPVSGPVVLELK